MITFFAEQYPTTWTDTVLDGELQYPWRTIPPDNETRQALDDGQSYHRSEFEVLYQDYNEQAYEKWEEARHRRQQ